MRKILILAVAALFAACGKDDTDYDIPKQQTDFQTFLETKNLEYTSRNDVYRHIAYREESAENSETLGEGSVIAIRYVGGQFSSSANYGLNSNQIFTTNRRDIAEKLGFTEPQLLPEEPLTVTLGAGALIRGLDIGLQGCRRGDIVYLYITSDLAYDNEAMGTLAAGKPVVFEVMIDLE